MVSKEIISDEPETQNETVRLTYSTPMLEEYGELHSLTHGSGAKNFDGGSGYSAPG